MEHSKDFSGKARLIIAFRHRDVAWGASRALSHNLVYSKQKYCTPLRSISGPINVHPDFSQSKQEE